MSPRNLKYSTLKTLNCNSNNCIMTIKLRFIINNEIFYPYIIASINVPSTIIK